MRTTSKISVLGFAAAIVLGGCTSGSSTDPGPSGDITTTTCERGDRIAAALPVGSAESQSLAKNVFDEVISDAGYLPDVRFADPAAAVASQQQQIDDMIAQGAKVILIGPQDGEQLGAAVAAAQSAGIPVIAFRQPINSADVDYLVGYDSFEVGRLQGGSLVEGLAAVKGELDSYGIELFAGSPPDPVARLLFDGAMEVLQPKIDDGSLVVRSGQTSFDQVATQDWQPEQAQQRMADLIAAHYTGGPTLDGVLAPSDQLAGGIIAATGAAGLAPVVTGAGAEVAAVQRIAAGQQYSTVYEDTVQLITQAVSLVQEVCGGQPATTTATFTWPGSDLRIAASYLQPVVVTRANAAEVFANNPALLAAFQEAS